MSDLEHYYTEMAARDVAEGNVGTGFPDRIRELEAKVERLTAALAEEQAESLRQAEIARDALADAERLTARIRAFVHANDNGWDDLEPDAEATAWEKQWEATMQGLRDTLEEA